MKDLLARIVKKTELEPARAEKALGITLSLLRSQGNPKKIPELFAKLPGADELADRHGTGARGGLLGMMGGPIAAIGKLQSAGLDMDQIKALGMETLAYAREKAGADLVKQAVGSIKGLGAYV